MAKKKMSKQAKRRLLIFGTLSVIAIVYFIFSISFYTVNIYKLKKQEAKLNTKINDLTHNEKLLNTEIEKLKDNEYIARFARENYSYSKDGEIIIKIDDSKNKNNSTQKENIDFSEIRVNGASCDFEANLDYFNLTDTKADQISFIRRRYEFFEQAVGLRDFRLEIFGDIHQDTQIGMILNGISRYREESSP